MSSNLIASEVTRFRRLGELFDNVITTVENIEDDDIKQEMYGYLGELEELMLKSTEWESRHIIEGINLTIFGCNDCGKRDVLNKFLPFSVDEYFADSTIRLKHVITLEDQSKHLLLIRDDGDCEPYSSVYDWSSCALFMFNINKETSLDQATLNHNRFRQKRTENKVDTPAILVGIINDEHSVISRAISYETLLNHAKTNLFHKYIEVRLDRRHNIDFLFEYSTSLSLKIRNDERNIDTTMSQDYTSNGSDSVSNLSTSKKRKTMFATGFKTPDVPNRKRLSTRECTKTKILTTINPREKSYVRSNSIVRSIARTGSTDSLQSIFTTSSGDNDQDASKTDWFNEEPLKEGLIARVGTVGSSNFFLTITKRGTMFYHKNPKQRHEGHTPKFIDLLKFNVKIPGNSAMNGFIITDSINDKSTKKTVKKEIGGKTFEMLGSTTDGKGIQKIIFKADSCNERNNWVDAIREAIMTAYNNTSNKNQNPDVIDKLVAIQSSQANEMCAECNAPEPDWMSCNLGVFICERCSGGHRNLGTHISKVLSTSLDTITQLQPAIMNVLGNAIVNSVYEATLELTDVIKPDSSDTNIADWLRMKYVEKRFLAPLPLKDQTIAKQLMMAINESDYRTQYLCIQHASKEQLNEGFSSDDERNALLIASQSGMPISVQLLLWAQVDPHVTDNNALNAHGYASYSESDNHNLVKDILVHHGVAAQVIQKLESQLTQHTEHLSPDDSHSFVTKRKKCN